MVVLRRLNILSATPCSRGNQPSASPFPWIRQDTFATVVLNWQSYGRDPQTVLMLSNATINPNGARKMPMRVG
jgi:hypothetical protein